MKLLANSSRVASGEWPLDSSMKPPTAMRGVVMGVCARMASGPHSRSTMITRFVLAALLAGFCALAPAQNLTLGTKLELNTLDPHFFAAFPTNSSMQYFFDKLVEYGDKLEIRPALATSWKLIDNTTWEFKLRKDVVFHDGTPFTAEDVIFSIERV